MEVLSLSEKQVPLASIFAKFPEVSKNNGRDIDWEKVVKIMFIDKDEEWTRKFIFALLEKNILVWTRDSKDFFFVHTRDVGCDISLLNIEYNMLCCPSISLSFAKEEGEAAALFTSACKELRSNSEEDMFKEGIFLKHIINIDCKEYLKRIAEKQKEPIILPIRCFGFFHHRGT